MSQTNLYCTLKHALNLICSAKELLNDFQTNSKQKLLLEILVENQDPSSKILKNYNHIIVSDWHSFNLWSVNLMTIDVFILLQTDLVDTVGNSVLTT